MTSPACPICGRPLALGTDRSAVPFCSMRCRQIDLGRWLGERYRIAEPLDADPEAVEPAEAAAAPDWD